MPTPPAPSHSTSAPAGVYVLQSADLEAWVIPYGARLMQLFWRSAPVGPRPLSLGFANPLHYHNDSQSLGAVCGRYANRIANARLEHADQSWQLDANHPLGHCIHGGRLGFGQRNWKVTEHSGETITLTLHSPAGDMGFPGNCQAQIRYRLLGWQLQWQATVTVDAPCPLNLVQHSYWNLAASADICDHRLRVSAAHYWPNDSRELPTHPTAIATSVFDFQTSRLIPADTIPQLDAALILPANPDHKLREVAWLSCHDLAMALATDRPLLHLYAAGNLSPTATPLGVPHQAGSALCLESEDLPNGPALGADVWYSSERPYHHQMQWTFQPLKGQRD